MGDDTYYTIQVKGTAYRFRPIPQDDLVMVLTVTNMGASAVKPLKALTRALADSAGAEQWDELTDRLIVKQVTPQDLMDLFSELVKRQNAGAPAPAKQTRKRAAARDAE